MPIVYWLNYDTDESLVKSDVLELLEDADAPPLNPHPLASAENESSIPSSLWFAAYYLS